MYRLKPILYLVVPTTGFFFVLFSWKQQCGPTGDNVKMKWNELGWLTYKTDINNFSLCPFLLARGPEYEGDDDAREDAEDVEDGQDIAPEATDHFGRGAHVECSRYRLGERTPFSRRRGSFGCRSAARLGRRWSRSLSALSPSTFRRGRSAIQTITKETSCDEGGGGGAKVLDRSRHKTLSQRKKFPSSPFTTAL